jgi:geranyl-CoA carboxylase alpha subunit
VDVLGKPAFAAGQATTAFIAENYSEEALQAPSATDEHRAIGACLLYRAAQGQSVAAAISDQSGYRGFTGTRVLTSHFRFGKEETAVDVHVREPGRGTYAVSVGEHSYLLQWLEQEEDTVRLVFDGVQLSARFSLPARGEVVVQLRGVAAGLLNQLAFSRGDESVGGSGTVTAPMHGNLMDVFFSPGDSVEAGDDVAVMEAMKMEHRLTAQVSGKVVAVHVSPGDQLASGTMVLEIAEND